MLSAGENITINCIPDSPLCPEGLRQGDRIEIEGRGNQITVTVPNSGVENNLRDEWDCPVNVRSYYTFPSPGRYTFRLITGDGTSTTTSITVGSSNTITWTQLPQSIPQMQPSGPLLELAFTAPAGATNVAMDLIRNGQTHHIRNEAPGADRSHTFIGRMRFTGTGEYRVVARATLADGRPVTEERAITVTASAGTPPPLITWTHEPQGRARMQTTDPPMEVRFTAPAGATNVAMDIVRNGQTHHIRNESPPENRSHTFLGRMRLTGIGEYRFMTRVTLGGAVYVQSRTIMLTERSNALPTPRPPAPLSVAGARQVSASEPERFAVAMLVLVNNARRTRNLSLLQRFPAMDGVATRYAERMVRENFFSHDDPQGHGPENRLAETGIRSSGRAENIFDFRAWRTFPTVGEVFDGWMESPGHRNNILSRSSTHMGIGLAIASNGTGAVFVQMFATNPTVREQRPAATPAPQPQAPIPPAGPTTTERRLNHEMGRNLLERINAARREWRRSPLEEHRGLTDIAEETARTIPINDLGSPVAAQLAHIADLTPHVGYYHPIAANIESAFQMIQQSIVASDNRYIGIAVTPHPTQTDRFIFIVFTGTPRGQ